MCRINFGHVFKTALDTFVLHKTYIQKSVELE
jgi:hypothetical protein